MIMNKTERLSWIRKIAKMIGMKKIKVTHF